MAEKCLAAVYCWAGNTVEAINQLEQLAKMPAGVTCGELKFSPWWDALRNERRFQKLCLDKQP